MTKRNVVGADAAKLAGLQIDTLQKIRNGGITLEQWEWFNNLSHEQRKGLMKGGPLAEPFTRLISDGETLILDACDGTKTIAQAKDTFTAYLDGDFENYGTNKPGRLTEAQPVVVHELIKDGNFPQIFGSLGTDLNKLCHQQDQVINFTKKFRQWLRQDGYATLFLFKVGDQFFVAGVHVCSDGPLSAYVSRFGRAFVWYAGFQLRVVLPQQ